MKEIFEKRLRMSRLFDAYRKMLTEKQCRCMKLYFDEDLSLSEIAAEVGVSRQAVFDLLRRAELQLEKYESCLGLAKV